MTLSLGVDTGGTYTDAVLIRDETHIVAKAKALTTRPDLAEGIGAAVGAVLQGIDPAEVGMAALSTTLATNALVEGQGDRVALIAAGFRQQDLDKHGLTDALKGDPVLLVPGRMAHDGAEAEPLDMAAVEPWLADAPDVGAYAVAGLFAVRNPAHEQALAEAVTRLTGRPVSASHHLSAKLNGPKRALTAVLNARLVGMIDRLISQAEARLMGLGVSAPLMVVRGDGALVSAVEARRAPIETILSGPAASIVGARWLTGVEDALVSDIGGTTTDIAVLRGGQPKIDPMGARVGPYRTMVEAVAMRTHGLGGDSAVQVVGEGLAGAVTLGPRRVVPISLLAAEAGSGVLKTLEAQLSSAVPGEYDGRFVRPVPGISPAGLAARDADLLARIDGVHPLGAVLRKRVELGALGRLVARGLVQECGVTPSDAAHVLGLADAWDATAAGLALSLIARRRTGAGEVLAATSQDMARLIVDQLTRQTAEVLLETALDEDGMDAGLARHPLIWAGLRGNTGAVAMTAGLGLPVVGLGASAATWYPAVGQLLRCEMRVEDGAEVANAIGAVVGRVRVRRSGTVTSPSDGLYRVHLETGPEDFAQAEAALTHLEDTLRARANQGAIDAGAEGVDITVTRDIRTAQVEAREVFVEAEITVEASGRPRIARA